MKETEELIKFNSILKESRDLASDPEIKHSCPRIPLVKKYGGTDYLCRGCPWHLRAGEEYLNCSLIAWDFGEMSLQKISELTGQSYATVEGILRQAQRNVKSPIDNESKNAKFKKELQIKYKNYR